MFVLSKLEADVRVSPQDLIKPPLTAVTEVLEREYLDKVIPELGLAVTIYDVLSVEGGHIYPNDGAAYFKVVFRLVVFRPFAGEVVVGKIISCNKWVPGPRGRGARARTAHAGAGLWTAPAPAARGARPAGGGGCRRGAAAAAPPAPGLHHTGPPPMLGGYATPWPQAAATQSPGGSSVARTPPLPTVHSAPRTLSTPIAPPQAGGAREPGFL